MFQHVNLAGVWQLGLTMALLFIWLAFVIGSLNTLLIFDHWVSHYGDCYLFDLSFILKSQQGDSYYLDIIWPLEVSVVSAERKLQFGLCLMLGVPET